MEIIVSPSDLTFLFQLSPWGFYQKYRHGIKRPYVPFPSIFTQIDNIFKETLEGMNLKDINENFPDATIGHSDEWVVSKPIINEEYDIQVVLRGKIDSMLSYADGTYGYYALFNNKAKINTIRSLKWHLLTLWYLNPDLNKNKFTILAEYIIYKENGFVTFNIGSKLINKVIDDIFKQDLDTPPKNRLRKIVFKDSSGLTTIEKLKIVGKIIGQAKGIKQDDVYEAMLYIHEQERLVICFKYFRCDQVYTYNKHFVLVIYL